MVVREGMRLVLFGLLVGLGLGAVATRPLSGMLIDVPAIDPATFAVVSIVLAGVTLLASYVPARRAAAVDPMVALRYE
jgi:putative ABC transport system permease protein